MADIRNASEEDVKKLCEFKRESVREDFPGCTFNPELYTRILLRTIKRFPERIKVAHEDGKVVGFVWMSVIDSAVGMFGRIEDIFVEEGHRGKGIGRMLMETAESQLSSHDIKKVKLTVTLGNDVGISLYEKLGYRTRRHRMEKDL